LTVLMGEAAVLGLSPHLILRADPLEMPVLVDALKHAAHLQHERDKTLALMIANNLARSFKR
jgi:hypothetical protein